MAAVEIPNSSLSFDQQLSVLLEQNACCVSPDGELIIGTQLREGYQPPTLSQLDDIRHVAFWLGEQGLGIFKAFCLSPWAEQIAWLRFGSSTDALGGGRNYAGFVQAMQQREWPALVGLSLGEVEHFQNTVGEFGQLGELSALLEQLAKLQALAIHGQFELARPCHLPQLRELSVALCEEGGITDVGLSQLTVSNLLSCRLDSVEQLYIDLAEAEIDGGYRIPSQCFSADQWPSLEELLINGEFRFSDQAKLLRSPIAQRPNLNRHLFGHTH